MLELAESLSEFDLSGWLFVNYPTYLSQEEAREQLEYEILAIWDEDEEELGVPEDERNDELPTISPFWLFRVLKARAHKEYVGELSDLSESERLVYSYDILDRFSQHRARNWSAIKSGEAAPLPELPFPQEWKEKLLSSMKQSIRTIRTTRTTGKEK